MMRALLLMRACSCRLATQTAAALLGFAGFAQQTAPSMHGAVGPRLPPDIYDAGVLQGRPTLR